jgi:pimeloyl-ACP methyl ester carboxylesterase
VALHGACDTPEDLCAALAGLTSLPMACARGNASCEHGGLDWAGPFEARARAVGASAPGLATGDTALLVGWSRGAYLARDLVLEGRARPRALVLLGAHVRLDAAALRAAGVRRVVFASGEHDGAAGAMRSATTRLVAQGFPARFVSLGPVWHQLPRDLARRLAPAVAWALEAGGGA